MVELVIKRVLRKKNSRKQGKRKEQSSPAPKPDIFAKPKEQKDHKNPISIDDIIRKHMVKKVPIKTKHPKKPELESTVQPYKPMPLTESSYFVFTEQLNYDRLYSYLGKLKTAAQQEYSEEVQQVIKSSQDQFTYKEVSDYLRKFTVNTLLGAQMNDFSIKEKEQFNNYAMFNKHRIMLEMQTNLRGIAQTDIPAPVYSREKA